MKKLIFCALLLLFGGGVSTAQTWQGNTIVASQNKRESKAEKTPYNYKDSKGKVYPVFISKSGSCFIEKTSSKSGKQYRQYLGKQLSADICKKLGRTYKPRNNG